MRILYLDIDTLRPDHLGCYGYHRKTSPNLDKIASEGVRFENCHASDVPCLPSRAAMWTGRFGFHTGVVNHGGQAADMFPEGLKRGFRSTLGLTSWMNGLRSRGIRTVSVSPFAERHSAWWWYAGFNEVYNTGRGGMEVADEVSVPALDWIRNNGGKDNWFLHVNFWDPHAPYRAPAEFGNPFKNDPAPAWFTNEVLATHRLGCGPHSSRETRGFAPWNEKFRSPPQEIVTMDDAKSVFDGYDTGIRYADEHAGRVLGALADIGVLNDTVIMVSSDHGENLGELNIYGDHQTADQITTRVPMIIRWPGITDTQKGRKDSALHYQNDAAATVLELAGAKVPDNWDAKSFAPGFRKGTEEGRDSLVLSQMAWSCQRAVRFEDFIYIYSYHDGYHAFPKAMLFDLKADPFEQKNIAPVRMDVTKKADTMLDEWQYDMLRTAQNKVDPMMIVLDEGGPFHCRGELPKYLIRLRNSGRARLADALAIAYPREAVGRR